MACLWGLSWDMGLGPEFWNPGCLIENHLLKATPDSLCGCRDGMWGCPKSGPFPPFSLGALLQAFLPSSLLVQTHESSETKLWPDSY